MKSFLRVFVIVVAMFFVGCGGGGSEDSYTNSSPLVTQQGSEPPKVSPEKEQIDTTESKRISMIIGKSYVMQKGQTIIKESKTAQIHLETEYKTGKTTAMLLKGKARIED
jgi:hypothetical protein